MIHRAPFGSIARPDCVGNPIPQHRSASNYYNLSAFALPPTNVGASGPAASASSMAPA